MSEPQPPASGGTTGATPADERAPTSPEADGASAADATPPPASAAPPPPATPPPGPGETPPPPPAPPPPVDLSAAEADDGAGADPSSPPLPPPPPPPPVEEVDEPRDAPPAGPRRSWTPVFLVLLALSVGVGGYFGFRGADDDDGTGGTTATTGVAGEFQAVHDTEAGFTVAYPKSWSEIAPASGEQRLLVSAGGQSYFQVKVRPVDPATVDQQIAEALADVRMVVEPRQITLNGVKTYYFLYYTDVTEQSPVEGVHAHYFLINGDQLYTMVFQALPTDQFSALAPTFDKVAESFTLDDPVSTPEATGATSSTTAG